MKHKLLIFLLIISSLFIAKSLFHPGFFTSHDGEHQIVRLMHFHQGLVDSQFPVRWAGTALDGNGYPLFIFTYRLPFWVAEAYYSIFHNLSDSIKFSFIFSYVLSGITMYWFAYVLTKNKVSAFMGSLIYQIAPYRFVDIFVRGALGEAFTFIFIPTLFLSIYHLASSKKYRYFYILLYIFSLSGIILSHIMILFLILIPTGIWFLLQLIISKQKIKYLLSCLIATLSGIGLTTYYWFPAFWERRFTHFFDILGTYYQDHFATINQLIYSRWGYGFSKSGPIDNMSFQIGLGQWAAILFTISAIIFLAIYPIIKTRLANILNRTCTIKDDKGLLFYLFYCLVLFSYSLFMSTESSARFYHFINKIMVIDLPWKHVQLAVFGSAFGGALSISLIKSNKIKTLIVSPILILLLYGNRNYLRANEYTYKTDSDYWSNTSTSNQNDEYAPKDYLIYDDVKVKIVSIEQGIAKIFINDQKQYYLSFKAEVLTPKAFLKTNIPLYPGWESFIDGKKTRIEETHGNIVFNLEKGIHEIVLEWHDNQILNLSGESDNNLLSRNSNSFNFETNVTTANANLVTKVTYYPGWNIYVDGKYIEKNLYRGRIAVALDKGYHKIQLKFLDTPLRKFANWVSLMSLFCLIIISALIWKKPKLL